MTATQPYLLDPSNAWLFAPPPRRVPLEMRLFHAIKLLFFPGFIILGGAMASDPSQGFQPTPGRIVGLLLIATCTAAFAGLAFRVHWKKYRRETGLLRSGCLILGEVLTCTAVRESGPAPEGGEWTVETVTLEYVFVASAEARITGEIVRTYGDGNLPKLPPPRAGEAMAVLYLDDGNYRVL